jgi:hypothetical protein
LNNTKRLQGLFFALLFLALLAFISSVASAEVITYDYDNAGQVKNKLEVAID